MTSLIVALCIDAIDPVGLARFWSGVLRWEGDLADHGAPVLRPNDDAGFPIRFLPAQEQKKGPNQMHFDLTSGSSRDQRETVDRAIRLGGQHIDIGQRPEEGHVVLADPEGNEFCVIPPGNRFLADCGFLGALASDGTQQVGYFWSEALAWPLVWDQDQETAIRSPHGGPKITWGGPPLNPKPGTNRLHFDLAPLAGEDHHNEIERLLSLGATRLDRDRGDGGLLTLADPDGNEFCLLASR